MNVFFFRKRTRESRRYFGYFFGFEQRRGRRRAVCVCVKRTGGSFGRKMFACRISLGGGGGWRKKGFAERPPDGKVLSAGGRKKQKRKRERERDEER